MVFAAERTPPNEATHWNNDVSRFARYSITSAAWLLVISLSRIPAVVTNTVVFTFNLEETPMRAKHLCLVALAVLAAVVTLPVSVHAEDPALKKIQGTWQFVTHDMGGQSMSAEQLKSMTVTFKDDKWSVRDGDKVIQAGTHKFDSSKTPGQVDAVVTEGQDKGNTMLGIFEMNGNTMKVCFDPQGKSRPTSFKPKADNFLAVVERRK